MYCPRVKHAIKEYDAMLLFWATILMIAVTTALPNGGAVGFFKLQGAVR